MLPGKSFKLYNKLDIFHLAPIIFLLPFFFLTQPLVTPQVPPPPPHPRSALFFTPNFPELKKGHLNFPNLSKQILPIVQTLGTHQDDIMAPPSNGPTGQPKMDSHHTGSQEAYQDKSPHPHWQPKLTETIFPSVGR